MTIRKNEKIIVSVLLFITLIFWLASWYVEGKQSDYRAQLALKISEQETVMAGMAVLIDNDGADAVVSDIIKDCPLEERARFDMLLGSLSQLDRAELIEVDRLFEACASFYADQKLVLTARFKREIEVRGEYLDLYAKTGVVTPAMQDQQEKWEQLYDIEVERTHLTADLVAYQGEIIDLLLEGWSPSADSIKEKIEAAQSAKDKIMVSDINADTLRNQLINV